MKTILFLLILIPLMGFSQIFTENFNNFVKMDTSTASMEAFYLFDSTARNDLLGSGDVRLDVKASKGNDLTYSGADWTVLATATSFIYSGSSTAIKLDTSTYFTNGDPEGIDINTTESFTILGMFDFHGIGNQNQRLYSKLSVSTVGYNCNVGPFGTNFRPVYANGGAQLSGPSEDIGNTAGGERIAFASVLDRAADKSYLFWMDDDVADSSSADATNLDGDDIRNANNFRIGDKAAAPGSPWAGEIHYLKIYSAALTEKQIWDELLLAPGWVSRSGNVHREDFAFHQGVYGDTIAHALTGASGNIKVQFDAKSPGGGSVNVISGDSRSQTITATSTTYNVKLAGGDSLKFGAAVGDTVYVDNVTVSLVSGDPGFDGHAKSNKFPGFK